VLRARPLWAAAIAVAIVAVPRRADAVVPVIVGPLQALLAILPSLLLALGGALLAVFRPSFVRKLVSFLWHQKVFTAILVAVVAGVVLLAHQDWGRGGPAATEMRTGTHWPAFRGGPARRGAAPDSPDPTVPEPMWSFDTDAKIIYSSPAVVGNRVYVATADKGVFADEGAVLCLDAETGAEVWRYAPSDFRATFSSPAVDDAHVVCGEGLHTTEDSRITCLDLSGKRLWELRTKSHVESSPCIYKGRVYVGAGDDGYYCIDLEPGPDGKPHVVWHLGGGRYKDCETSPAAADGRVYFGLGMGGNAICAVDAATGRELWRAPAPYPVFGPPTLAHGKLYVGMGNGNFVQSAEQVRALAVQEMREAGRPEAEIAEAEKRLGPAGEVWCLDPATGAVAWRYRVARTVLGAVAAGDGRLYFGSSDGLLHCISAAGKPLKTWNARDPIMTSPALGQGHVYFGTAAGRLHCLNAETLEPAWDAPLGNRANYLSSPSVALGRVYIGTDGDGLRCIGCPGERLAPLWTAGERGGSDRSPLPERASVLWSYPRDAPEQFTATAPLMMLDGALYVPCSRADRPGLVRLKLDADIKADADRVAWAKLLPRPVTIPPGGLGDCVYAVVGTPGKTPLELQCLNAADGAERWTLPLDAKSSGQFALNRRHLYVWTGPETLTCLPAGTPERGEPIWSKRLGEGAVAPAPGKGILVVATKGELLALDDGTGTILWRQKLAEAPLYAPVRLPKLIVLAAAGGLEVRRIVDGTVAWKERSPGLPAFLTPLTADEARVAAVTAASTLVVHEPGAGTLLGNHLGAWRAQGPLLASDGLLFASGELNVLREDAEAPKLWARTSWLGRLLTPFVLHDSHVCFATEKRGIVCLGARRR